MVLTRRASNVQRESRYAQQSAFTTPSSQFDRCFNGELQRNASGSVLTWVDCVPGGEDERVVVHRDASGVSWEEL